MGTIEYIHGDAVCLFNLIIQATGKSERTVAGNGELTAIGTG